MNIIGLTGGIGMGKSVTAEMLAKRNLPVVDTDVLAREVVAPGQPALQEIRRAFGPDVLTNTGELRRDELARRVFADPAKRNQLEAIVHPRIRDRWHAQVAAWRAAQRPEAVVVVPLLFEVKAEAEFDYIICVACSRRTQLQRLQARGWTAEQIAQRNRAQWPSEKKMAAAHFVIWSEGGFELHAEQLERVLARIAAV